MDVKWIKEGTNLLQSTLNSLGFPSDLTQLPNEERDIAINQLKKLFSSSGIIGGNSKESNIKKGRLTTEQANLAREVLNLSKWVPLDLIASDSRHRLIRNNAEQRKADVERHILSGFDFDLMWQRNQTEAKNNLSRLDTDINNQSSFLYRSITELLSNAIDASNPSRFSIGRFGVGFYQIFQHLRTSSDFITLDTTREQDEQLTRLIFRKGENTVEVSINSIPKSSETLKSGTKIVIEAGHLDAKKAFQFCKNALKWNSDAKIIVNRNTVNSQSLDLLKKVDDKSLPVVRATLKDGIFTIKDEGCGMSADDVLHRLLVPKLGSKSRITELSILNAKTDYRVVYGNLNEVQKGETLLLVGGVKVGVFNTNGINVPKSVVIDLPHSTKLTEERDGVYPDKNVEKLYIDLINQALALPLIKAGALLNAIAPVLEDFDERSTHRLEPNFLINHARKKFIDAFPRSAFIPNVEGVDQLGLNSNSFVPVDSKIVSSRLTNIEGVLTNPRPAPHCRAPAIGFVPFLDSETRSIVDGQRKVLLIDDRVIENIGGDVSVLNRPINSVTLRNTSVQILNYNDADNDLCKQYPTIEELIESEARLNGYKRYGSRGILLEKAKDYSKISSKFLKKIWPKLFAYQKFDAFSLLEDALWAKDEGISLSKVEQILSTLSTNFERFCHSNEIKSQFLNSNPNPFEVWNTEEIKSFRGGEQIYICDPDGEYYYGNIRDYRDYDTKESFEIIQLRSIHGDSISIDRKEYGVDRIRKIQIKNSGDNFSTIYMSGKKYKIPSGSYGNRDAYDFEHFSREELEKIYYKYVNNLSKASQFLTPSQILNGDLEQKIRVRAGRSYSDQYGAYAKSFLDNNYRYCHADQIIADLGDRLMLNRGADVRTQAASISSRIFSKLSTLDKVVPLSETKINSINKFIKYNPELSTKEIGALLFNAQTMAWISDSVFEDLISTMSNLKMGGKFPIPESVAENFGKLTSESGEFRALVFAGCINATKDNNELIYLSDKLIKFVNIAEKHIEAGDLRNFITNIGASSYRISRFIEAIQTTPRDEKTIQMFLSWESGLVLAFFNTLADKNPLVGQKPRKDPERAVNRNHSAHLKLTELVAWAQSNTRTTHELGSQNLKLELPVLQNAAELFAVDKDYEIVSREISHAVESTTNEPFRFAIELISNALDAERAVVSEDEKATISVRGRAMEGEKVCLSVTDNKGMDLSEVVRYLLIPGQSSKAKSNFNIGFFGQGFYTALQRADKIVVQTRKVIDELEESEEILIKDQGLQLVIEPIREAGLVVDASVKLSPIKTKKIGTTIHWVGNHKSPAFWSAQVGAEIHSNFRYLDADKALVKFNGRTNRLKRKLIGISKIPEVGEIKLWSTNEYREVLSVKDMPVGGFQDFMNVRFPRFMLKRTSSYSYGSSDIGLQCDLPAGIKLTRSRKGLAATQAENLDLKPIITKMVVSNFLKRLQKLPAREVAHLFPFDFLPTTYFLDPHCFDTKEQEALKEEANSFINGGQLEDLEKYEEPQMIARLMAFMPIFAIKGKHYSLEQLKEHFATLTGPFEDSVWIFSEYSPGTSEAIRDYIYNVCISDRIKQFDIQNPYTFSVSYGSGSGSGSSSIGRMSISASTLEDLLQTCKEKDFDRMLDFKYELSVLRKNSKTLLKAVYGVDDAKDWKVLFEANVSNNTWNFSPVKVSPSSKAVIWNAGAFFMDSRISSMIGYVVSDFLKAEYGAHDLIDALVRTDIRTNKGDFSSLGLGGSYGIDTLMFDYWMRIFTTTNIGEFAS